MSGKLTVSCPKCFDPLTITANHCEVTISKETNIATIRIIKYCADCRDYVEIILETEVSEIYRDMPLKPHWEAVIDVDTKNSSDEFWRVRWSQPNNKNEYLYAAHYGGNGSSMNRAMAQSTANRWNEEKKSPRIR